MLLVLVAQAFGWSHRGHVWAEDELPLRVCAARPLDAATDQAIALWNRDADTPWLVPSCDLPHIHVGFDDDAPGAIAAFTLQPSETAPKTTPCAYTRLFSGRADVRFSGDVDWTQPVGTAAGLCAPEDLQVRLLARYLGVTLGLDSSPDSDVMGPFGACTPPVVTAEDHDGLLALYGFPGSCSPDEPDPFDGAGSSEAEVAETPDHTAPRGCTVLSGPAVTGWMGGCALLFVRRRTHPVGPSMAGDQNKPS